MKKLTASIMAVITLSALTACNKREDIEHSGLELIHIDADRVVFDTLNDLENANELAIVGEIADEPVSKITKEYSQQAEKDVVTFFETTSTVEVKKVLKGDVQVGDKLTVGQYYGIEDGKLYTTSELTPMVKGDEWIFFLRADDNGTYWCYGDADARYPTQNSESNTKTALTENSALGVYDKDSFNEDIYNEIKAKYF